MTGLWRLGQVSGIPGVPLEDILQPTFLVAPWQERKHSVLAATPLNGRRYGVNLHADNSRDEVLVA